MRTVILAVMVPLAIGAAQVSAVNISFPEDLEPESKLVPAAVPPEAAGGQCFRCEPRFCDPHEHGSLCEQCIQEYGDNIQHTTIEDKDGTWDGLEHHSNGAGPMALHLW